MRRMMLVLGLAAGASLTGCANLDARRVPLSKRLSGQDEHYHGFRYYLSRPYLVVSERVDVVSTQQRARVFLGEGARADPTCGVMQHLYLETIDEHGCPVYFDLQGRPQGNVTRAQVMELTGEMALDVSQALSQALDRSAASRDQTSGMPPAGEAKAKPPSAGQVPTGAALLNLARSEAAADEPPAPPEPKKPPPDKLQIIFLPDFEEQMAVKHVTALAKSKISLAFQDGWQLKAVNGNFDATDVPVQVLNTIRNAIGAAGELETKRQQLLGAAADQAKGGESRAADRQIRHGPIGVYVIITRTLYIEPGVYRLQKPSEQHGEPTCGAGLLADLGIPVAEETKVQLAAKLR